MASEASILSVLKQLAAGLAAQFGRDCEVVIHDVKANELEHSIVYIENGHVSGRQLGDGASGVVLETRRKRGALKDQLGYMTRSEDGKRLKSSTMYIRGDDGQIEYILAINYDVTGISIAEQALRNISSPVKEEPSRKTTTITHNVNELLDSLIEQSVALVGKPVSMMTKDDKIAAIHFLQDAGAFLITKSGDKISQFFGISKFTLYSYMNAED